MTSPEPPRILRDHRIVGPGRNGEHARRILERTTHPEEKGPGRITPVGGRKIVIAHALVPPRPVDQDETGRRALRRIWPDTVTLTATVRTAIGRTLST